MHLMLAEHASLTFRGCARAAAAAALAHAACVGRSRSVPEIPALVPAQGVLLTGALMPAEWRCCKLPCVVTTAAWRIITSLATSLAGDWDGAATWAPLLAPAFLEGLWRRVLALWEAAGFVPKQRPAAAANPDPGPLRAYLRSGRLPCAGDLVPHPEQGAAHPAPPAPADAAWLQDLFCAFLALTGAPRPTAAAAAAARAAAANPAADPVLSLPVLAESLPGTPPKALAHLAACLPLG